MSVRPPLLAVPKSLYKHFAVLTVVLTLGVAMFADGARREEIGEQIAAHQKAKAQEMKRTQPVRGPMVGGMRDNRGSGSGYVVNNNPDVGDAPDGILAPSIMVLDESSEMVEDETIRKARLLQAQAGQRKLPPVLPPGMSALPGMPGSPEPVAVPDKNAA